MHISLILALLLQIVLILALSRLVGMLFRYLHQPQVMGEMLAGIMLGPSLFGWIAPDLWKTHRTRFPQGPWTHRTRPHAPQASSVGTIRRKTVR